MTTSASEDDSREPPEDFKQLTLFKISDYNPENYEPGKTGWLGF